MNLSEELLGYSKADLQRWISKDFTLIDKRLPDHIRMLLTSKATNRKSNPETTRFFSEICILNHHASMVQPGCVWYSSYKWLTKDRWLKGEFSDPFKSRFYMDLMKYIGEEKVAEIQERALIFRETDKGEILGFTPGGKIRFPVGPDIWMILNDGKIKFVEGKHKERIDRTQLVGLALIKKYLDCHISIMRIFPNNEVSPAPEDYSREFMDIYERV